MKNPDWTSRQNMRYPPEAMKEAVEMLKPANTPKPRSIYSWVAVWMYCVCVLGRLSPHKPLDSSSCGLGPELAPFAPRRLWGFGERVEGQGSGSPGGNQGGNLPLGPPRRHTKPLVQRSSPDPSYLGYI